MIDTNKKGGKDIMNTLKCIYCGKELFGEMEYGFFIGYGKCTIKPMMPDLPRSWKYKADNKCSDCNSEKRILKNLNEYCQTATKKLSRT